MYSFVDSWKSKGMDIYIERYGRIEVNTKVLERGLGQNTLNYVEIA